MTMKTENVKNEGGENALPSVNKITEILEMLDRGISIFERGYLPSLSEMKRAGLIDIDLYNDGTSIVRKKTL